jgi:2-polyprenyl-6-methoxyphenol hydroxylase-like FAD-dependent oxidoreductase
VGINIQPHAVRELNALGLNSELDNIGLKSKEVAYFSKQGDLIWSEPRGIYAGYNWPQYSVNRGDLQMLLYKELTQRAGSNIVRTNATLKTWENSAEEIELTLVDRKSQRLIEKSKAEIVIGCDGINSAIRAKLYPDEGPAKWSGIMMWRGTTKGPKFLSGKSMVMVGEKKKKFVGYPIHKYADGNVLINWICDLKFPNDYKWAKQDWHSKGKLSDLWPSFKDWNFPWLDVAAIIQNTSNIYKYPMVDRDPIHKWTFDQVTLLGDAAHAMYPIGSNGASQAILDAVHLARALEKYGLNSSALNFYEDQRRGKVNTLIKANRGDGPDKILDIVANRAPNGFKEITDVVKLEELRSIALKYKSTAGFDIDRLNESSSIMDN